MDFLGVRSLELEYIGTFDFISSINRLCAQIMTRQIVFDTFFFTKALFKTISTQNPLILSGFNDLIVLDIVSLGQVIIMIYFFRVKTTNGSA